MSIAKPTLSDIWANAAPAGDTGIADPGGLKDTGWTAASACPPFSWMNWILNKCDAASRYMLARGVPDWDSVETYSQYDRVQSGGITYLCISPTGAGGGDSIFGPKWAAWGHTQAQWQRGIPDYDAGASYIVGDRVQYGATHSTYICILPVTGTAPPTPTYWSSWGHTDAQVTTLMSTVANFGAVGGGLAISAGTIASAGMLTVAGIKMLFLGIGAVPYTTSAPTITLTGLLASVISVQATILDPNHVLAGATVAAYQTGGGSGYVALQAEFTKLGQGVDGAANIIVYGT